MDRNEIEDLIKFHEQTALDGERIGDASDNDAVRYFGKKSAETTAALRHLLQAQTWRPISEAPQSVSREGALQSSAGGDAEDDYMAFYTKLSPLEKQLFKAIGIPFQLQDFGHNILEEDGEYFEQTSEQMDRFTDANKIALSKVMSIVRSEIERLGSEAKDEDGATKSDQAYQVIGTLAAEANCFEHPEVQRALDYFCEDGFDPNFLPFLAPSRIEEPRSGDTDPST